MSNNLLEKVEHNRFSCSVCGNKINKGENLFRSVMQKWRASHTVNICEKCILEMGKEVNEKRLVFSSTNILKEIK